MTAQPLAQETSRPLVLVVEDEVLVRLTISAMLEEAGFKVLAVTSAEEALEVLGAIPDIRSVVTDVELSSKGMSGFELARKLSAEQNMGVVVVSGRAAPEDELPSGVYFIAKPFHRATLVQLVRDLMGSEGRPSPIEVVSRAPAPPEEPSGRGELEAGTSERLTPRQRAVLECLVQGKSNREIAEALDLAENTVKVHMAAVFRALGVSSRTEAVLAGLRFFQAQLDVDQGGRNGAH